MGFHLMMESARMTKEEHEARDKVVTYLRNIDREAETGMPTIPSWAMAADQFTGEGV